MFNLHVLDIDIVHNMKVELKNMDIYIPYLIKFAAVVIPTKSIALRL